MGHGRFAAAAFAFALIAIQSGLCRGATAVGTDSNGRLTYEKDSRGNRIPDFSSCGYAGANRKIPDVHARVLVAPAEGDDGARIQAALDEVALLPIDDAGMRGAVVLLSGKFEIAGQLRLAASGVVLRGSGALDGGTTLVATGDDRRTLIHIVGTNNYRAQQSNAVAVIDDYAPVGATTLSLQSTDGLAGGDAVMITRPSTIEWIHELGANALGLGWRPGSRDLRWDRRIMAIDGNAVTIDAPVTTAIDAKFGGATLTKYRWPGRIQNVGIEDLRLESQHDATRPLDEDHAWFGITLDNARDAWVRRIAFAGFAGGAVAAWETTSRVTVEDCAATHPVSELAGWRRQTFFTQGQQSLFLRCWAEEGRRDFCAGHCAAGPNAFVNCVASRTHGASGPIESWAAGVLYDNVRIDGGALVLENRWTSPPGAGWSAGNCVLWQCQAATMRVFRPPTASNWAIGVWAMFAGDGHYQARGDFASPLSLYQAQLRERVGEEAGQRVGPFLLRPESSTNPTAAEAANFVERSNRAAPELVSLIEEKMRAGAAATATLMTSSPAAARATVGNQGEIQSRRDRSARKLKVNTNGWLVIDDKVLTGGTVHPKWWAGSNRPTEAPAFGASITRYVPGRVGEGLTDDLPQVAADMQSRGDVAYDHHYGLWYDLRRADHLIVRQADAGCAPPFYEQPFARTGLGRAWDGLSKYDLTAFNPWYWGRLRDFAALCDERGLALIHEHYFQHNVLEAGAHWVDSPWRPENNINDTGFPEPPPFIGDKRIFLARQFYDVKHSKRRALHRGYIRQCLAALAAGTNVIQMTSAEYSGPLEFTQFWIDVVAEWENENGQEVIVALSAPKDVQDSILADPKRASAVDVIDIRYWAYTADGRLYAPAGGQNLAPRQRLRQSRARPGGFREIARAVREYRRKYPDKAVTYFADRYCPSRHDGWAVLMGGGSLADVPPLPADLAAIAPTLRPIEGVATDEGLLVLGNPRRDYLIYSENPGGKISLELPAGKYRARWIDPDSGESSHGAELRGGARVQVEARSKLLLIDAVN
jgi:hypothetical protein